jgi:hypothetical protein
MFMESDFNTLKWQTEIKSMADRSQIWKQNFNEENKVFQDQ